MRARPVVVRFRRFYRRPPTVAQRRIGYQLDIGPWLHSAEVADMLRELGLG